MTDSERESLILSLGSVVCHLEEDNYAFVGVIRRALQELALADTPRPSEACPVCGGEVTQPALGRRRRYCGARCRNRARKKAA
jgi:hypothetical protein